MLRKRKKLLRPGPGGNTIRRFRPPREHVKDFLGDGVLEVEIDGSPYQACDVSMSGLLLDLATPPPWTPDQVVEIEVRVYGERVFRGRSRVVRAEALGKAWRVPLELLDGFLDLPYILRKAEEIELDVDLAQEWPVLWGAVPRDYRELVGRAAWTLRYYRTLLDQHEQRLRELGPAGRDPIVRLAERAIQAIRAPWDAVRSEGAAAALELMGEARKDLRLPAKEFTEAALTSLLLDAPVVQRAYEKPLGYAGDYQTMGFIYRNAPEGNSVFARVFHKLAVEEPLAAGVRTRKDWMKEVILAEAHRSRVGRDPAEPFRVASVGAGPAVEISELLREGDPDCARARWTLVDLEENALSLAWAEVYPLVRAAGPPAGLNCFHTSFATFVATPLDALAEQPQDLIYAAGLFDYIPQDRARRVLDALFRRLAPGGLLVVGNALWPNTHFWFGEFVLDWSLIYRTRDQMLDLASQVDPQAERMLVIEPSNAYFFLSIRKPT